MPILRRQPQIDSRLLANALAEEPPLGAGDIPLDVSLAGRGRAVAEAGSLLAIALSLTLTRIVFGFGVDVFTIMLIAGHVLLAIAAGFPDFSALNRKLHIAGEGVRLEKIHRTYLLPWWELRAIHAKEDISEVRLTGASRRISIDASGLTAETRKSIIHAIRARAASQGLAIEPWPRAGRFFATARSIVSGVAGMALVLAGITVVGPPQGTLGVRCSVNSDYLKETFETPDRQGCVVLRVSSGAEKAGIQRGDLVIQFEGSPVTSGQQFTVLFDRSTAPWDLTIVRKGLPEPLHVTVRPGRRTTFREDEGDPFFYYLRARWDAEDKPEQATGDYSRAIAVEPRFDLAYLYRGELYEQKGDRELARRDYDKALELSPGLGEAHSTYAYFIDHEDRAAAFDHVEEAIRLDHCADGFQGTNFDCAVHYLEVSALFATEDLAQMADAAERSIRYYPLFSDPYFQAACAYARLGDSTKARDYANQYLDFPESDRDSERTKLMEDLLGLNKPC